MTRNLAFSLMRHNIRVNEMNPGWMDTPSPRCRAAQVPRSRATDWLEQAEAEQPIGRLIKPPEVGQVVTFYLFRRVGDDDRQHRRLRPVGASAPATRRSPPSGESGHDLAIGILGCGRIGKMHAELVALRGARCSRCADGARHASRVGRGDGRRRSTARYTAEPDELLGAGDVDAVAICSVHRHPRRPADRRRRGRQAHLLREAAVARPGRGRSGPRGDPGLRRAAPGRLQPPLRPEPPARCGERCRGGRHRRAPHRPHHQPRPGAAAHRLHQGVRRDLPAT